MKCTIPEIAWHNKDPVLSVDIQPVKSAENDFYRLASAGADCHILIWHLKIVENGKVNLDAVSDLKRHQKAINVVRWSASGQYLASGDDDANIIIWKMKTDNVPLLDECSDKEIWISHKVLRGHKEDIYDLCWSPDELKILSGSIDNTAIIWDVNKGKVDNILTDHKGFVQGVSWDPKDAYVATLCSDRTFRIFDKFGKQAFKRIRKGTLPLSNTHDLHNKEVKYYHDDTFKSYFRRLTFSPDGLLLITPSGCIETEDNKKALNATYIFTLEGKEPVALLPTSKQNTIAARCCPLLFELRPDGPESLIPLPYRMIIAVATDTDVLLYDTQQKAPFAYLQKIHYTRLTDITWSCDGLVLICSSTDGFCTFVTFSVDELGVQYTCKEMEKENVVESEVAEVEEVKSSEEIQTEKDEKLTTKKKLSLLEQWAIKSPKGAISKTERKSPLSHKQLLNQKVQNLTINDYVELTDSPEKESERNNESLIKTPKRIVPIKIGECSSPKRTKTDKSNNSSAKPENKDDNSVTEVANSNCNTTPKRNTILKFLTPKRKSNKKSVVEKNTDDKSSLSVEVETEARDAWKCSDAAEIANVSDSSDDIPPDFKLEITNSSNFADSSKMENSISVNEVEKANETNSTESNEVKTKTETTEETNKEKIQNDNSVSSSNESKPKGRRVQLITISGPKKK